MPPVKKTRVMKWTPEQLEKIGVIKRYGYYDFHVTKKRYLDWLCGEGHPLGHPKAHGEEFYAGPVNVTARRYCRRYYAGLEECEAETEEKLKRCFKINIYCIRFEFTINPEVWENPSGRAYKHGSP